MDSENFVYIEIDESLLDEDIEAGATVYGLILDEQFYLLPPE
jgi:hypothetical protein